METEINSCGAAGRREDSPLVDVQDIWFHSDSLPGKRFYERHGFIAVDPITYVLGGQLTIEFVRMEKRLSTRRKALVQT